MTEMQVAEAVMLVGGLEVTAAVLNHALEVLNAAPGLMVRQPLCKAGNLLAECDYHAVAAPYKNRFTTARVTGRGAAGRHITKQAFILALEEKLAVLAVQPLVGPAWEAFTSDCSYASEIAAEAVRLLRDRHLGELRKGLRQACHQAVSACEARRGEFTCQAAGPCGTGSCRFAPGRLARIEVPSVKGAGRRPANHEFPGAQFSVLDVLPVLAELEPFQVRVP